MIGNRRHKARLSPGSTLKLHAFVAVVGDGFMSMAVLLIIRCACADIHQGHAAGKTLKRELREPYWLDVDRHCHHES